MKNKKAFSLVETIVVLGVIGFVLPAMFAIIFSILKQQVGVYRLSQVKEQGDSALGVMSSRIRTNAVGIYSDNTLLTKVCVDSDYPSGPTQNNGTLLYFKDKSGAFFYIDLKNNQLNYVTGTPGNSTTRPLPITSNKVKVSNFSIVCKKTSPTSPPIVNISYTVLFNSIDPASPYIPYRTRVVLRNL